MSFKLSENASKAIEELQKELKNSQNRLSDMETVISEEIKESFAEKASVDNVSWKPATQQSMEKGFKGNLKKTGKMFRQFQNAKRKPSEITFQSKVDYDWTHQFGSEKANIPARPFLPIVEGQISKEVQERLIKMLEERIDEIIKLGESKTV